MDRQRLQQLWSETLLNGSASVEDYDRLADAVLELCRSGDPQFREHLKNRSKRVIETNGIEIDPLNFDISMAKAFVADEIAAVSWDELISFVEQPEKYSMLFRYAIAALWRGDFSALQASVGSPDELYRYTVEWHDKGWLTNEQETADELLSAACMLGDVKTAAFLLEKGVDPYAGMRSWLAGPHYAASSGRVEMIKLLIDKKVPLEVENKYGGTVLGQALWSAINEHTDGHAEIIERLIDAGAFVWPGTFEWWMEQDVPSEQTKNRVAAAMAKKSPTS